MLLSTVTVYMAEGLVVRQYTVLADPLWALGVDYVGLSKQLQLSERKPTSPVSPLQCTSEPNKVGIDKQHSLFLLWFPQVID